MCVEVRFFRNVSDPALVADWIVENVDAVQSQRAGAGIDQTDDGVDRRAFTGAVRPQVAEDLSTLHLEVDAVKGEEPAVSLRQSTGFEHDAILQNAEC